ncbi:MAG: glycosyltransferase, partial [Gallionella sp.]
EDGYDAHLNTLKVELRQKIHRVAFTSQPESYMAAADILCLPSYREGFGSVVIESAAVGIPAVASRIYGITDAIIDHVTGILHEPGNSQEICQAMFRLAHDEPFRCKMGAAARERVIHEFSQERLTT